MPALLLAGCAVVSGELGSSYQNRPDPGDSFLEPGTPVPRATTTWRADKPTFIGIGISGGGSRAANFGMAVLDELDALGIMQHVDAVSAVSGGSIPAAYFALNGERVDWGKRGREVAGTDFLSDFIGKLVNPANFMATTFTDKDRSDVLAEVFQGKVLDGPKTFADLGPRGPRRPAVYFNATDTTNSGERFVFADDRFLRLLGSDLSQYPIAWAIASSGAFPGVFNSVTLRRFSLDPDVRKGQGGDSVEARYIHLIDGGPSDNLGTDTLIDLARQHHVQLINRKSQPKGCLLILVDSHVPNATITESKNSDRRNPFAAVVDLNFVDAIDAMLTNRRQATLARVGIRGEQALGRFTVPLGDGLIEYNVLPYRRVSTFQVEYYEQDGRAVARPSYTGVPDKLDFGGMQAASPRSFTCTAWHVALDNIHSVVPWKEQGGRAQPLSLDDDADRQVFVYRGRLSRLLKQVATNYRLSGPPDCAPDLVQQSIFDAAYIAVREDKASIDPICAWMTERGLADAQKCRPMTTPVMRALDVEPIEAPRDATMAEQNTNRFVQCGHTRAPVVDHDQGTAKP